MANYIKATNFTAKDSLPSGDSARIVKGTEIDVEFSAISASIASKADSNSPSFTGTPTAPTAVAGTNTTQLATTAFALNAAREAFPIGGIIIWSGSVASIPATWQLCDGTNGTPNLRDRFVVGAGSTYAVNATGGSANAAVPEHTHSLTGASAASAGTHQHFVVRNLEAGNEGSLNTGNYIARRGTFGGDYSYDFASSGSEANIGLTSNAGAHVHSLTGSTASAGVSGVNANLPPYYALCYIMKVS
jgi:hypothetical protein